MAEVFPDSDPVRVLCVVPTGWKDRKTIERALQTVAGENPDRELVVVHASEPGKIVLVAQVARSLGYLPEPHYALWNRDCDYSFCEPEHRRPNRGGRPGTYCPAAGVRRDLAMVRSGADLCVTFSEPTDNPPTCVLAAGRAGIPVRRVERVSLPRPRRPMRRTAPCHRAKAGQGQLDQVSLW